MRSIADFIMRGRMQATLVVVGSAVMPLLFWLSAAAAGLVLLRRGASDVVGILVWAVLPAALWWYLGNSNVFMVLAGTLVLAQVLRATGSWTWVLLTSVVLGVVFTQVLTVFSADVLEDISQLMREGFKAYAAESNVPVEQFADVQVAWIAVLPGYLASSLQVFCVLCLVLARYWQAALYNPGGFALEFRAIRLQPAVAIALLLGVLLAPVAGTPFAMWAPLCTVPLFFAALALGHGLVKIRQLSGFWLVVMYGAVLIVGNLICLLAVVDSLFDFRGRLARKTGAGPANGEG